MAGVEMKGTIVLERLLRAYQSKKYEGFVLPGGSRSSKTFSIMQLVILYCQENFNKGKRILFARQKYSDLKDTVMRDWFEMLMKYGIYQEKNHFRSNPQSYQLYGNMIYFRGLDAGGAHGEAYDIFWINEAFESEEEPFFQLDLRLRKGGFFFLDYNPYFTEHWILNKVITRPEVWLSPTSTIVDNPFMAGSREYGRVMSLDPSNPVNVRNGTADDALWQIYGLGIGASITGVIYTNVTWIEKFPDNLDYWYGMDFGFTSDPTTIIKTAVDGNDLYWEERFYDPVDNPKALSMAMAAAGIERHIPINADSSDKFVSSKYGSMEMVKDLRELGWNIQKVSKVNDIVFWIGKIKEMNLHIVQTYTMSDGTVKVTHFQEERQKYKWKTINGSSVNQPIDAYNHCLDGGRYGFMMNKKRQSKRHFWN